MKHAEDVQAFLRRLKPIIRGLLRSAHAMTGNQDLAENALIAALHAAFVRRGEWRERMSFREGIMRELYAAALSEMESNPKAEFDWPGLSDSAAESARLIELIEAEPVSTQRVMVLRFGCDLAPRDIAKYTLLRTGEIKEQLSQCQLRMQATLRREKAQVKPWERLLTRAIRHNLNREDGEELDTGYIFRCFERDADDARPSRHIAAHAARYAAYALAGLLCAALFWVLAILMA